MACRVVYCVQDLLLPPHVLPLLMTCNHAVDHNHDLQVPSSCLQYVLHATHIPPIISACRQTEGQAAVGIRETAIWQPVCSCSLQTQQGHELTMWGFVSMCVCLLAASLPPNVQDNQSLKRRHHLCNCIQG